MSDAETIRAALSGLPRGKTDALDALDRLEHAFRQACMNLATIRPGSEDISLGEAADRWAQALLDGLGSPW